MEVGIQHLICVVPAGHGHQGVTQLSWPQERRTGRGESVAPVAQGLVDGVDGVADQAGDAFVVGRPGLIVFKHRGVELPRHQGDRVVAGSAQGGSLCSVVPPEPADACSHVFVSG